MDVFVDKHFLKFLEKVEVGRIDSKGCEILCLIFQRYGNLSVYIEKEIDSSQQLEAFCLRIPVLAYYTSNTASPTPIDEFTPAILDYSDFSQTIYMGAENQEIQEIVEGKGGIHLSTTNVFNKLERISNDGTLFFDLSDGVGFPGWHILNRVAAVSTKGLTINDNYIWKQENRPVLEELVALFRIEETIDARCRVLTHSSNDTDEQIMNQIRGHGGMLGSERVRVFNNRMLPNHDRLLYASFALIESPSGFKPRPDIFSKIESNSIFDYKTYRRWNNHMSRIQSQIGDL